MTHPKYTAQTLDELNIPHLKSIYAQIGCTAEVGDKRKKAGWVTAILEYQANQTSEVQAIPFTEGIEDCNQIETTTIYKEKSAEVQAIPPVKGTEDCNESVFEIDEAQLFRIASEENSYAVYLHGEWLGNIHPTEPLNFAFTKESWCLEGDKCFVSSTLHGAVKELKREFANSDEVQTIPKGKGIEDCNQIEATTPKVQLFEPKSTVQVADYTITFVETLPSGQHAHRCEKGGSSAGSGTEFVGYLFQVPDDETNTSYHWETNGQQFLTLEAVVAGFTISSSDDLKPNSDGLGSSYDILNLFEASPTPTMNNEKLVDTEVFEGCNSVNYATAA